MRTQYYTATSLDGFIATEDDSLEWLFPLGDLNDSSYPAFISEVVRWLWDRRPTNGCCATQTRLLLRARKRFQELFIFPSGGSASLLGHS